MTNLMNNSTATRTPDVGPIAPYTRSQAPVDQTGTAHTNTYTIQYIFRAIDTDN